MSETTSEYITPAEPAIWKRISWPAVFAGTFVALAVELLFAAFGLFIGFTISSPGGTDAWSKIWYFISTFVALFAGGWVAARLSTNTSGSGRIHGAVTWGLTTITTFAFVVWLFSGVLSTWIEAFWTTVATTNAAVATPATGAIGAGDASTLFLVIFGGVLCGCVASLIGGGMGGGERFPFVPVRLPMPGRSATSSPHSEAA